MPEYDFDRPRRKKSRRRAEQPAVRPWIRVCAFVIVGMGVLGTLLRFADRARKPKPAEKVAVAPAQPAPPAPGPVGPQAPPERPKRPISAEPPPAGEIVARIVSVREVPSQFPVPYGSQPLPYALVVDYEYTGDTPKPDLDVVSFCSGASNGGAIIKDEVLKGSFQFHPERNGKFDGEKFAGEVQFWIAREGAYQRRVRISNIYTFRR